MYELRPWFHHHLCLYTDDPAVRDAALARHDVAIASSYFRLGSSRGPIAWDLVGREPAIRDVVGALQAVHTPRDR
jgi:hypothetical protein